MSKNKFNFLSVGQPYPLYLSNSEGAVFEFIGPSENILLITLRDISKKEKKKMRKGDMRCGLLAKDGAILLVWQFGKLERCTIILDTPFDSRLIPDIQLPNVTGKNSRLLINVIIVDVVINIVCGIRSITFTAELTVAFFSAIKNGYPDLAVDLH